MCMESSARKARQDTLAPLSRRVRTTLLRLLRRLVSASCKKATLFFWASCEGFAIRVSQTFLHFAQVAVTQTKWDWRDRKFGARWTEALAVPL